MTQVIERLQDAIAVGDWQVGARLPVESELATEYGVSRVTLRQAVQALVHVGQLETIQGSGTFVRATTEVQAVVSRYLATKDLRSVLELRQALESQAAALAATRSTPQQRKRMTDAVAWGKDAADAGDAEASEEASFVFHQAVVEASHNPPLVALYSALAHSVVQSIREASPPDARQDFVAEHRAILTAIEARDAETASTAAHEHLTPVIAWFDEPGANSTDDK